MSDPRDVTIESLEKLLSEREQQYAVKLGEFVCACDAFDAVKDRFDVERRSFQEHIEAFENAKRLMREEIEQLKTTVGILQDKICQLIRTN